MPHGFTGEMHAILRMRLRDQQIEQLQMRSIVRVRALRRRLGSMLISVAFPEVVVLLTGPADNRLFKVASQSPHHHDAQEVL
jgi:hypothetical protein